MEDKIIIILATRNQGKTAEIQELLKDFPADIKNLVDFGKLPELEEDGTTFEENAYKKASFAARILGYPAMADDSGICVEALKGAPGIHSARYAEGDDKEKYAKLLDEMKDKENRNAYFQCVISIAVPTGKALTYEGKCEGIITKEPFGAGGFGYDPVFYYPALNKTFAQLSREEKGRVSHRGLALNEIKNEFDKIVIWIKQNMPIYKRVECVRKCVI